MMGPMATSEVEGFDHWTEWRYVEEGYEDHIGEADVVAVVAVAA